MKASFVLILGIIVSVAFPGAEIIQSAASAIPSQKPTETNSYQPPKTTIKSKPAPHYPKEARAQHIEATIVLRAIFTSSGKVTDLKFSKAIPSDLPEDVLKLFTEESINAARKIKFEPATKAGHPVSMYVQLEYNFRLD